ncbi:MAG TPA: tRNA lysidine(34) synthetase TilS [Thermodesulfobacteriota bacterium]|nr:tRNA lysidine(34) synthetase TilS [Thermodesulfobacteriota bacterium]
MIEPGEKVLAAVSGGADSMALLHLLGDLREDLGFSLLAAHLDHGLRPGGDEEGRFVEAAARALGAPFFGGKADAMRRGRRSNIQEGAREARYAFLSETARRCGASRIALGHTADDQAESVLMRFLRGSGALGLSGIPPVRGGIFIRPLIEVRRAEIEAYLETKGVRFLSDPSNESNRYLRNRVRNELLPILATYNPRIRENLARMADLFRSEDDILRTRVQEEFPKLVLGEGDGAVTIDIPALSALPPALRFRAFRAALEKTRGDLRSIDLTHIAAVERLAAGRRPNAFLRLPGGVRVTRAYGELKFSRSPAEPAQFEHTIPGPGFYPIPEIGHGLRVTLEAAGIPQGPPTVAFLQFDDIDFPLTVRSFRAGDRFRPFGMSGEKKIKDFFVDCKIPVPDRKKTPILCKCERVLWVAGLRIDDRARLTPETRRVLRAELE